MGSYAIRRRVLVTGGAGFPGAYLDKLLERGDVGVCVDNAYSESTRRYWQGTSPAELCSGGAAGATCNYPTGESTSGKS